MQEATIFRSKKRILTDIFLGDELKSEKEESEIVWVFEKKMNSNKFKREMFQYRKKSFMDSKSELVECGYCGIPIPKKYLTRDHFKPKAHGFRLKGGNCIMCCRVCNSRKADWNMEEWLKRESVLNPSYFHQICSYLLRRK